ncbi:hypothetical protein McpSp1_07120 [Methanocorpusculaceae archaeon Sp1]|nr:hypothetical protein [Methanocorpusculaceae archaeon Sp1]
MDLAEFFTLACLPISLYPDCIIQLFIMKSVAKKNDAVSPVIGTILLVAITVVLVAIVAAVVMGMVGGVGQSKTVGVTVVPGVNATDAGFTFTLVGGADAGSLHNVSAYMSDAFEDVSFDNPGVGKPYLVPRDVVEGGAVTGTLTLTGTFNDGSKYVIYQSQVTIPADP